MTFREVASLIKYCPDQVRYHLLLRQDSIDFFPIESWSASASAGNGPSQGGQWEGKADHTASVVTRPHFDVLIKYTREGFPFYESYKLANFNLN